MFAWPLPPHFQFSSSLLSMPMLVKWGNHLFYFLITLKHNTISLCPTIFLSKACNELLNQFSCQLSAPLFFLSLPHLTFVDTIPPSFTDCLLLPLFVNFSKSSHLSTLLWLLQALRISIPMMDTPSVPYLHSAPNL